MTIIQLVVYPQKIGGNSVGITKWDKLSPASKEPSWNYEILSRRPIEVFDATQTNPKARGMSLDEVYRMTDRAIDQNDA
jgi:hypothetical protein